MEQASSRAETQTCPARSGLGTSSGCCQAWDADPAMEKVVLAAFGRTAPAASGAEGSSTEPADATDAGDGLGSLTNPFKNAKVPPAPSGGPVIQDPTATL